MKNTLDELTLAEMRLELKTRERSHEISQSGVECVKIRIKKMEDRLQDRLDQSTVNSMAERGIRACFTDSKGIARGCNNK